MGEVACVGEGLGIPSMLITPLEGAGGVVETVDVVVIKSGADVVGGLRGLGLGSGGGSRSGIRRGLSGLSNGCRRFNNRSGLR